MKVAYDHVMPTITVPTKSGYVFGGYFSGKNGVNPQYYDENGKCVMAWNRKWGSTIYAKWISAPYTVTLDRQGGSGGAASVKAAYGYALPAIAVPKRSGYVFGGYFSGKNGVSPQFYDADGKCVMAWNRKWGSTIYAKWTSAK